VDIECQYARRGNELTGDIEIHVASRLERALTLRIKDHGYGSGDRVIALAPRGRRALTLALARSHCWYDFSVTIAGAEQYLRRFAGRVETGKSGISDPAMGRVRI
jgi:phospholipase C